MKKYGFTLIELLLAILAVTVVALVIVLLLGRNY